MISETVQFSILHSASSVLVEMDSFAFILRMVELLMLPLYCSVYVVASFSSVVLHSGA